MFRWYFYADDITQTFAALWKPSNLVRCRIVDGAAFLLVGWDLSPLRSLFQVH
jgi:hypothetical protein